MPYLMMQDGTQIYYEDRGKGETMLILHGVTASHRKMEGFVREFLGDYRCVTMDLRGHGGSNHVGLHMNLKTLAQDVHELMEYLDLKDVTIVGHSLGGGTIFSYVSQFGCDRLKRIVNVDMTPCASNRDWKGGLGRGEWTDADYLDDIERYFDNRDEQNWVVTKELMMPALKALPPEAEHGMVLTCMESCECDAFTAAGLWYSVFRTDSRPGVEKITVPFLHVFPETPICTMEAVNYVRDHAKGPVEIADGFPGTSHMILLEAPVPVAEKVKAFMKKY